MREYPDAMQKLIEKGTEMLRKEGKIDEELAARHIGAEVKTEQKFSILESHLDKLQNRVAQLLGEFNASDRTLKQRLTRMEYALAHPDQQAPVASKQAVAEDSQAKKPVVVANVQHHQTEGSSS